VLPHRGLSPTAIVLLLIAAMVGGGLEIRPAPAGGCSIATDDHVPDPQPREESPDESAADEEGKSAKHAALAAAITLEPPAARGGKLLDRPTQFAPSSRRGTAFIRGPPSPA